MKRAYKLVLLSLLCISLVFGVCVFSGCGEEEEVVPETSKVVIDTFGKATNGILLHRDLTLTDVQIEEFDMNRYNVDEFRALWQQEIDEYNNTYAYIMPTTAAPIVESTEAPKEGESSTEAPSTTAYVPSVSYPITMVACSAQDNTITMELTYANMSDYRAYNADMIARKGGTTIKTGTLALMDSEVAQMSFVDTDGKAVQLGALAGLYPAHYRYIYCDFQAIVYGEGDVVAITSLANYDKKNNCVTVQPGQGVAVIFSDNN